MNPFTKIVTKCDALHTRLNRAEAKVRTIIAEGDKAKADWIARNPELAARIYR